MDVTTGNILWNTSSVPEIITSAYGDHLILSYDYQIVSVNPANYQINWQFPTNTFFFKTVISIPDNLLYFPGYAVHLNNGCNFFFIFLNFYLFFLNFFLFFLNFFFDNSRFVEHKEYQLFYPFPKQ